jgi:phosphoribosylaminoimidazole-succinocarboxamide synthase
MSLADTVLAVNHDLPIRTDQKVHNGKVRSVYWLSAADSQRLIEEKGYDLPIDTPLAVMMISDRISAFDCIWHSEGGLGGVPGKGAALNAISLHWFEQFAANGLAKHHIVDVPHPLVWIVQRTRPVMVEGIARQYITGSMWRGYQKGERQICGIPLSDGLTNNQKLPELLITPSTKGVLTGLDGVPEADDVNITRQNILDHLDGFRFHSADDVDQYEHLLRDGFDVISEQLASIGQIFVDTKFEFGYARQTDGSDALIYIDEVGTPDSSRIWDAEAYGEGRIVENSKEEFRQLLINTVPDSDVLLNKNRMPERQILARDTELPLAVMQRVSDVYTGIAEQITGSPIPTFNNPRAEIVELLASQYQLVD